MLRSQVPGPTRVYRFQLYDEGGNRLCGLVSKTPVWSPGTMLSLSTGDVEVVRFVDACAAFGQRHEDGYLIVRLVGASDAEAFGDQET